MQVILNKLLYPISKTLLGKTQNVQVTTGMQRTTQGSLVIRSRVQPYLKLSSRTTDTSYLTTYFGFHRVLAPQIHGQAIRYHPSIIEEIKVT